MKWYILFIATLSLNSACSQTERGATILYVGDSHSYGKLGTVVEKSLSAISQRIIIESSCGSTPNTWLGNSKYAKTVCGFWKKDGVDEIRTIEHQTPKFGDELAKYRPTVTIVQLGTNIAASEKPVRSAQSIATMMDLIAKEDSVCIWIGPPDANSKIVTKVKLQETNQLLIKLSLEKKCHYIDSLKMTTFPAEYKEGIHYPPSLSSVWGEKVSAQLLKIIKSP